MKPSALILGLLFTTAAVRAELPLVEDVSWGPLRDHCRQLLAALQTSGQPLPAETMRALQVLLDAEPADPQVAAREVQKLLDQHCLLGVTNNPESRVKGTRGPRPAELRRGRETLVLVKILNDGGVTHALAVRGPEISAPAKGANGHWLHAAVAADKPFSDKLSGLRLEYKVLRLSAHEAGKREATFQLDVGQGTQDLGFRAEVPVLFSVK
jgi:hypothetical protein